MRINFKSIAWKNFLATGNHFNRVSLDAHKTTIFVGVNGAGKSTMLDAITFALFGKPYRNINKPMLVNSINGKDCLVEIEFDISDKSYLVRRGIKPNIFEIYENGELIDQESKSGDYQEFLENNILKRNYKSFTQIEILGAANFKPFMQLTAADRRAIIEDLLDIQVFSHMSAVVKSRLSTIKEKLQTNKLRISHTKEKIEMHKKHLEEMTKSTKTDIDAIRLKITENETRIAELDSEYANLNQANDAAKTTILDKQTVRDELSQVMKSKTEYGVRLQELAKHSNFYHDNANCPTCKQEISDRESKAAECDVEKAECQQNIQKLDESIARLNVRINEIRAVESEISKNSMEIVKRQTEKTHLQNANRKLQNEVQSLLSKPKMTDSFKQSAKAIIEELRELTEEKKSLLNILEDYDTVSQLLKDGGIKTKVVRQYIPIINGLVNKYLSHMDFFVNFTMDEQFNEHIKSRHRDEFCYESFSEGQKKRIDLALLFTWREVAKIKNSANSNLLIFDEILDSSLDDNGTEELMKYLTSDSENGTNIFIISHKTDIMSERFDKRYKFYTEKDFSMMEET